MHMITEGRVRIDRFDDVSREIPWMARGEPHSPDPCHLAYSRQKFRKCHASRGIAIRVHILAQQLDLGEPGIRYPPRLFEYAVRRTASFLTPGIRHDAVRAKLVASLDDRDVPAMR